MATGGSLVARSIIGHNVQNTIVADGDSGPFNAVGGAGLLRSITVIVTQGTADIEVVGLDVQPRSFAAGATATWAAGADGVLVQDFIVTAGAAPSSCHVLTTRRIP